MAKMNGNIGTVTVSVGVDLEPSEQFDAVAKMLGYVKKRTCRYVWDEKQHAWVCDQCGGIEPCSNDVNYCCDCGAEVVG